MSENPIVDICNRACSQIAETEIIASISPPDASVEATQCALWYDPMRQRLLRSAPWGFARVQKPLTQIGDLYPDNTSPFPFLYAYAYPSDCLKFRYVLPQPFPSVPGTAPPLTGAAFVGSGWCGPSRINRYLVHNQDGKRILVTNVPNAIGVYTLDATDPNQFDALFTDALENALSFKLVVPLSGNIAMKKDFQEAAEAALIAARAVDGNEAIPFNDPTVDWIEARGAGFVFGNDSQWAGSGWGQWYSGWDSMNWGM